MPVLDVVERLIVPAMRHIGAGWPTGAVSIAQEHRASAACARLLADLSRPVPGRPRGTVVVTTPAGGDLDAVLVGPDAMVEGYQP